MTTTAETLLAASEARYRALFEHARVGILHVGADGTLVDANPGVCRMLGFARDELIGAHTSAFVISAEHAHVDAVLHELQDRSEDRREWLLRRKDGAAVQAEVVASPMPDGAVLCVVRDRSARRQATPDTEYRTEQLLRDERLFTDMMVESMPGILYFYDADGHFLRWNRNFETVSGYTGADIAAMHPREFFHGEDRARVEARIAEVFSQGEASVEAAFVSRDGQRTPYFFTGRHVLYDGRPCLIGMGIDISERREAEERLLQSERQYRELVQHANSIILRWTPQGHIAFLNDFGLRFFGYAAEELLGRHVTGTIVPVTDSAGSNLGEFIDELCANPEGYEQNINENMRSDGARVWVAWTNRVERDAEGRVTGILSIGADVTARRRVEAEREMRHRAEAADRIKSAFLATMSHELRTPLNSIIGFTGIVLQGLAGPLNDEQSKQLGMVRSSARHLLELVNDVLDISKIEAGQFEVAQAPFDLAGSIVKVVDLVAPQAEARHIGLRVAVATDLDEAVGDQRRFEQILLNLLSNAIKFTTEGEVSLDATLVDAYRGPLAAGGAGPAVRLRVADTGVGIKAEDLPALFQPFRQIDSGLSRNHDGTGLGLAICHRLAELMGGEIAVESEWGKGSTFTVTLPLSGALPP